MTNAAFNRKISLLTSKLNTELRKKLVNVIALHYEYMIQRPDTKKIVRDIFGDIEIWCWRKKEKKNW